MRNKNFPKQVLLLLLVFAISSCADIQTQDNNGHNNLIVDGILPSVAKKEVDKLIEKEKNKELDDVAHESSNTDKKLDEKVDKLSKKHQFQLALQDYLSDPEYVSYGSRSNHYLREDGCRLWKFQVHWGNVHGLDKEKQKSLQIDKGSIIPTDNAMIKLIDTVKFDKPTRDYIHKKETNKKGIHFTSYVKPHFDGLSFYHLANCGDLNKDSEDDSGFTLLIDDKEYSILIPYDQYRYSEIKNIDDANHIIIDGHIVRPKCNDRMLIGNLRQSKKKNERYHLNGFILQSKINASGRVRDKVAYMRSFFVDGKEGLKGRVKNHKKKNKQKIDGKYAMEIEKGYFKAITYGLKNIKKERKRTLMEGSFHSQSDFEKGMFRGFMADLRCERKIEKESQQ